MQILNHGVKKLGVAALVASTLALTGCGSDDAATDENSTDTTEGSQSTSPAVEAPEATDGAADASGDTGGDGGPAITALSDRNVTLAELAKEADMSEECMATTLIMGAGAFGGGGTGLSDELIDEARSTVPEGIRAEATQMADVVADAIGDDGAIDYTKIESLAGNPEYAAAITAVSTWYQTNCAQNG